MNYRDFLKINRNHSNRKISLNEAIARPKGDAAELKFYKTIRDYFDLNMNNRFANLTEVDPSIVCKLRRMEVNKDKLAELPGFNCWVCYSNKPNRGAYAFDLDPNSKDIIMYSFKDPTTPIEYITSDQEFNRFLRNNFIDYVYGLTTSSMAENRFDKILKNAEMGEEDEE